MSSSCGRTNGFNLDFVKSSSTSSPSSTTSETTNSPQSIIFTKKPRTLRKRPNQTFNEAVTFLSTAYPNLFSTKNLKIPEKFTKPVTEYINDSSEPLLLFREYNDNDSFSFLLESKRRFQTEPNKVLRENMSCELSTAVANYDELEEEFDCESMLDEKMEEGIDSIMGGRRVEEDANCGAECHSGEWFAVGGKFGWVRALRKVDDDTKWWNFLVVDMLQISPRMKNDTMENLVPATATKKKKVVKKLPAALSQGLLLKLNYDDVRNAWSDRGSPFADGLPGNDVTVRFSSVAGDLKSSKRKKVDFLVDINKS